MGRLFWKFFVLIAPLAQFAMMVAIGNAFWKFRHRTEHFMAKYKWNRVLPAELLSRIRCGNTQEWRRGGIKDFYWPTCNCRRYSR